MRKRIKRLTGLGLSLILIMSLFGCSSGNAQVADTDPDTPVEEVTFPLEETKELSFITSAPATTTQEPNEKLIFQRLEEQTNVHIDWTCFVDDQFADKKNLALAQFGNLRLRSAPVCEAGHHHTTGKPDRQIYAKSSGCV